MIPSYIYTWASLVAQMVKDALAMQDCKAVQNLGSVPGLGRPPGGGHVYLLQYFCLEIPRDRGAWRVTVYGVAKSRTRLND